MAADARAVSPAAAHSRAAKALAGAATPGTPAATCPSRVASDFNGDGYADIAAGAPWRTVAGIADAGAVRIDYGSRAGAATSGAHSQYFDQDSTGMPGAPTANDTFGLALAAGYFNDDCYADLAIGTPGENDVTVLYGSATGLSTTGASNFAGRTSGSAFGFALATGDFNHDGRDDLAASAPFAGGGAGEITTMSGAASALTAPAKWLNQATAGIPGVNETGDLFGLALAAGDFSADGFADLAVGVPAEDDGQAIDAGSVTVLRGSAAGISTTGVQLWTQDNPGVPGVVEAGDRFGYALAAGDVTGDGTADLVIGVPGEDDGSVVDGGSATFLRGSHSGLTATGSMDLTQDTTGVPGGAERGDDLGEAVAIGDFNGDGHADVALGVPGEDLTAVNGKDAVDAGTVDVLRGISTGPTGVGSTSWSQDSAGVPGAVEAGDEFGSTLLAARVRGSNRTDLVIGAQLEDGTSTTDCGAVTVLPSGPTGTGSQTFGEPGAQSGDEWGASLS